MFVSQILGIWCIPYPTRAVNPNPAFCYLIPINIFLKQLEAVSVEFKRGTLTKTGSCKCRSSNLFSSEDTFLGIVKHTKKNYISAESAATEQD